MGVNVVPSGRGCAAFARLVDSRARMIIGGEDAVAELWEAVAPNHRAPREDRPGQPVFVIEEPPEPGGTGLREATPDDLEVLVPACAAAHQEELGSDPLRARPGRLSLADAGADRRRPLLDLAGERHDPVQGRSVCVDAERHSTPTGLGRPGGAEPGECAARPARPLPPAARRDPGRLPVRPTRERARDSRLRAGRDAPPRQLPERAAVRERVEELIRRHELIPPGGEVTCLVSGGADSTCLWHVLRSLGYRVSALHVAHGLRGARVRGGCALLPRAARRRGRGRPPGRPLDRGRAARDPLLVRDRPPPGDRPHCLRPGRDRPLPSRGQRRGRRHQAEARGRSRPPAARGLARRDGGVLRRRGPRVPHGHAPTRTRSAGSSATGSCRCCGSFIPPPPRTSCAWPSSGRRSSTSCSRRAKAPAASTSARD